MLNMYIKADHCTSQIVGFVARNFKWGAFLHKLWMDIYKNLWLLQRKYFIFLSKVVDHS